MKNAERDFKIFGIAPPEKKEDRENVSGNLMGRMSLKLMQIEALNKSQSKMEQIHGGQGAREDKTANTKTNQAWYDRYIIERTSTFFVLWNLLNTIVSIVSSFLYAYMCAFGLKEGTLLYHVDSVFESIFILDGCLQFVTEYYDEKTR